MITFKGQDFIMSCSYDKKIKCWALDAANGKLNQYAEKVLEVRP
jgi:hypothetical protein